MSVTEEETPTQQLGKFLASILPGIISGATCPVDESAFYRQEIAPYLDQIEEALFKKYGEDQATGLILEAVFMAEDLNRSFNNEKPDLVNPVKPSLVCVALCQRRLSDHTVSEIEETLAATDYRKKSGVWSFLEILSGSCVTKKRASAAHQSNLESLNAIPFPAPHHQAIRPTLVKIATEGLGKTHGGYWSSGVGSCLQVLFATDSLTDEIWSKTMEQFTGPFGNAGHKLNCWDDSEESDGLLEGVTNPLYLKQQAWLPEKHRFVMEQLEQQFQEPTEEKLAELAEEAWMADLRGGGWLLFAARMIEHFEVKRFTENYEKSASDSLPKLVARLKGLHRFEDLEEFAEALKHFAPQTLELLRGKCDCDHLVFEKALGIAGTPLAHFQSRLRQEAKTGLKQDSNSWDAFFQNNDDPENGVLDIDGLREAAKGLTAAQIKKAIASFEMPGEHAVANAKYLFNAVFGINSPKVEASLKKFGQPAAKALGLHPLPDKNPEAEIEARYLRLLEFEKGCAKFGSERRANSAAAVQVGLENLSRNAGFTDSTRLQWWLEARLAGGDTPGDATRAFETGPYKVTFLNDSEGPRIEIFKSNKLLKSIPATLKKEPEYKELKLHCEQAKKQYSRIRARMEVMMREGEELDAGDLQVMSSLPGGSSLLKSLLLRTANGHYGFYDQEANALIGLLVEGEKAELVSLKNAFPLQIAHPIQLHHDRVLASWQAEIVRQHLVQPFKQVFREVYLLTDAERESATHSNRFHGRVLDAPVAARLLSSRNWKTSCESEPMVHRVFREPGIVAELKLATYGHYFTESGEVTTDAIEFTATPPSPYGKNTPLNLEDIDPQLYSEVLRDLDLVASVAYRGEGQWHSESSLVLRKELLQTLVSDLGVEGVRVEGRYALIKGTRAAYRVHLETGAIYIGTGNHICVVPDRSKSVPEDIYLPFTAEEDTKLREIISRILMLLNDGRIKDQVILSQIDEALA